MNNYVKEIEWTKIPLKPWGKNICKDIWLSARDKHLLSEKKDSAKTAVIMQDWGIDEQESGFHDAVESVSCFFDEKLNVEDYSDDWDLTTRRLYNSFSKKTQCGEVVLLNAIWALRNSNMKMKKSGILSDTIHRHFFKLWFNSLTDLGSTIERIVFCGAWARESKWGGHVFSVATSEYLKKYCEWFNAGRSSKFRIEMPKQLNDIEVWFLPHPSHSDWLKIDQFSPLQGARLLTSNDVNKLIA